MNEVSPLFSLKGRVAVLTGGTGTLGRAAASGLARAGARVAVLSRSVERARIVASNIGPECIAVEADVTHEQSVKDACETVLESMGRVDILVNFAGGNLPQATIAGDGSIFEGSIGAFRDVMELNLMGTLLPIRAFGQAMVESDPLPGGASIVTVASAAAVRPLSRVAAYSAAKAAVLNFTKWLAVDLGRSHQGAIRVNALAPGFFVADQNRSLLIDDGGAPTVRGQRVLDRTPIGRFGQPEELVGALVWLCGPSASFVTGSLVTIDGGFTADSGV